MKHLLLSSVATVSLFSSVAFAQEPTQLDTLVLSGGRVPISEESYARSNTILTEKDIEQSQQKTVADVLRQVPGLHVSKIGGAGGATAVRLRGSEANHVLVLINGVETPNSSEAFEFAELTTDQIERIEILRGPQSALYGAGATAGVINIITKGGINQSVQFTLSTEGGYADGGDAPSKAASALMQAGSDNGQLGLGVSYRDEKGWDSSDTTNGDEDGFENLTFNFKGEVRPTDTIALNATARYTDRESDFDDTDFGCGSSDCYVVDAPNTTEGYDFTGQVSADVALLNDAVVFTPRVSYAQNENKIHSPNSTFSPLSTNEASTLKFDPQVAFYLGEYQNHTVVIGGEVKREEFQSSFAGNDTKTRDSYGFVLDYNSQLTDALFVQAGARYDANDDFEDAVSWAASSSYQFETGTTLRASTGQGQTNPTFFEQFGFIAGTFTGNPDLEPEKNFSFDVGVDQDLLDKRLHLSATYFNERLIDAISGSGVSVINLDGTTKKQGVELAAVASPVDNLTVELSYTYLDGETDSGAPLARRPEHSAAIDVAYTFYEDRASVGASLIYFGDNYQRDFGDSSFSSPFVKHDGYTTVDLKASYAVAENIELFGSVKNVFNADYEEVRGFKSQPLTGYLGVKATW